MDVPGEILVIEDSDEDFEATVRAFRKASATHSLRRCVDGDDALDYLMRRGAYAQAERPPRLALVLLDLNLPGTQGHEVLDQIRAYAPTQQTPVVVLTTSSNSSDINDCYRRGASSYIIKPVDFDKLLASIRSLNQYWFETVALPRGIDL